MRSTRFWLVAFVAAVLFVALLGVMASPQASEAAPMPAPTPVSVNRTGYEPMDVTFFDAQSVTADTTSTCVALANYERADIYYNVTIDGSNVNTSTLTMRFGSSPAELASGVDLQAATAVSVTAVQQVQLFHRYACILIDTTDTSTGTVTVTAKALAK